MPGHPLAQGGESFGREPRSRPAVGAQRPVHDLPPEIPWKGAVIGRADDEGIANFWAEGDRSPLGTDRPQAFGHIQRCFASRWSVAARDVGASAQPSEKKALAD